MELDKDFKEFIELLNGHKVQYLVIGGYAVNFRVGKIKKACRFCKSTHFFNRIIGKGSAACPTVCESLLSLPQLLPQHSKPSSPNYN